jgi:hypothetical protein
MFSSGQSATDEAKSWAFIDARDFAQVTGKAQYGGQASDANSFPCSYEGGVFAVAASGEGISINTVWTFGTGKISSQQ